MFAYTPPEEERMETRRGLEFELYGDGFDLFYDGGYVVGRKGFAYGALDLSWFGGS